MNRITILAIILFCGYVNGDCLAGNAPAAQQLTFCTEYAASSCCSAAQDGGIAQQLSQSTSTYGTGACYLNLRDMTCALACHPNQTAIATLTPGNPTFSLVGYMEPVFASGFYESCKNVCIDVNGTRIGAAFNQSAFLGLFTRTQQSPVPTTITFGTRTGGAFNGTPHTISANETFPCPQAATTAQTQSTAQTAQTTANNNNATTMGTSSMTSRQTTSVPTSGSGTNSDGDSSDSVFIQPFIAFFLLAIVALF